MISPYLLIPAEKIETPKYKEIKEYAFNYLGVHPNIFFVKRLYSLDGKSIFIAEESSDFLALQGVYDYSDTKNIYIAVLHPLSEENISEYALIYVMLHEVFHAYQDQVKHRVLNHIDNSYNMLEDTYYSDPNEIEANEFARYFLKIYQAFSFDEC